MNEAQLEGHLEELRAKGLNTRGSLRRLLLQRAAKNDTAGVMELMKVREVCCAKVSVVLSSLAVHILLSSLICSSLVCITLCW